MDSTEGCHLVGIDPGHLISGQPEDLSFRQPPEGFGVLTADLGEQFVELGFGDHHKGFPGVVVRIESHQISSLNSRLHGQRDPVLIIHGQMSELEIGISTSWDLN
jgi:hypothetical protein